MKTTGFEQFIKIFGDITLLNVLEVILAIVFLFLIYKKVKDYLVEVYKAHEARDEQINKALEAYPKIEESIAELKATQKNTINKLEEVDRRITEREQDKARGRLLELYRYYTNTDTNPSQSWTKLEADAFWALFRQYEKDGGDGEMHTDVQPAMRRLKVIIM